MNFNRRITYGMDNKIKPSDFTLCKFSKQPVCSMNGIDETSVSMTQSINNTYTLTFTVNRLVNGEECNEWGLIQEQMLIHVENNGYFVVSSTPKVTYSKSNGDSVSVECKSIEYLLSYVNITSLKVNYGTSDSLEYLIEDNLDSVTNLPIRYINLHNDDKQFSLLDIIQENYMTDWTIGEVDESVRDNIYRLDIDSQNIYSFLTQDLAKLGNAIPIFDTENKIINIVSLDNLGLDTSIYIDEENLASEIDIQTSGDDIYTRFRVQGGDGLDSIVDVNFGKKYIDCLDYYLDEKWMSKELIAKYTHWQEYRDKVINYNEGNGYRVSGESYRTAYMRHSEIRNEYYAQMQELLTRVPAGDEDFINQDWDDLDTEQLNILLETCQAYVVRCEQEGTTDNEKYVAYNNYIIPNIQKAIYNKGVTNDDDKLEMDDSWQYNTDLYGINELTTNVEKFLEQKNQMAQYYREWNDLNDVEKEGFGGICQAEVDIISEDDYVGKQSYVENHEKYVEYLTHYESFKKALTERQAEYDAVEIQYNAEKTIISSIADLVSIDNSQFGFTEQELIQELPQFYKQCDYQNENFIVTDSMSTKTAIGQQYGLYKQAYKDTYEDARPQYSFSTTLDNLLGLPEFKEWHSDLAIGNFIHLGVREGKDGITVHKLRLKEITFNPCDYQNDNLQITFSDMRVGRNEMNDFASILASNLGGETNSVSSSVSSGAFGYSDIDSFAKVLENIIESNSLKRDVTTFYQQYNTDVVLANMMTQQYVFNRLTNGGTAQGLFRDEDGNIYINCNYIRACTLEAIVAKIGGYVIADNLLYSDNDKKSVGMSSNNFNYPAFWAGADHDHTGDAKFYVTHEGDVYGKNSHFEDGYFSGEIEATSGHIGGWVITTTSVYSDSYDEGNMAGINKYGYGQAFWAGGTTTTGNTAPYHVSHDGSFYSTKGQIASWTIDSNALYTYGNTLYLGSGCSTTIGNASITAVFKAGDNFGVTSDGQAYLNYVHASGGYIANWEITPYGIYSSSTRDSLPYRYYMQCPSDDTTGLTSMFLASRCSSDNGTTWHDKFRVRYNGALQCTSILCRDGLTNAYGTISCGSITTYDSIYTTGNNIRLGTLNSYMGDPHCGNLLVQTEDGSVKGDIYCGNIHTDGGSISSSDRNLKKDFTELDYDNDDRYYKLAEKIHYKLYRYIHGTSNRFHVGIVAQDLEQWMNECEIPNSDFAGLVINKEYAKDGQEKITYGVRYDEVNSLVNWYNKKRIDILEKEIAELKK